MEHDLEVLGKIYSVVGFVIACVGFYGFGKNYSGKGIVLLVVAMIFLTMGAIVSPSSYEEISVLKILFSSIGFFSCYVSMFNYGKENYNKCAIYNTVCVVMVVLSFFV